MSDRFMYINYCIGWSEFVGADAISTPPSSKYPSYVEFVGGLMVAMIHKYQYNIIHMFLNIKHLIINIYLLFAMLEVLALLIQPLFLIYFNKQFDWLG